MEEKTTKRLYLWVGIAVAVILCVIAGVLLLADRPADVEERIEEPSVPPALQTPAPSPTPTPVPSVTPSPTAYILPLVPQWDAPSPSPTLTPPKADARGPALPGVAGRYDDTCKDLLAVGIQNGMATAVLLVRVQGTDMSVVVIPCETVGTVYSLDADCRITAVNQAPLSVALRRGGAKQRQKLWNLVWAVKNTLGIGAVHYVALDLDCLVEMVELLGGLAGQETAITPEKAGEILASAGDTRALGMAELGVGLVHALRETALWELPALQKLTKDKVWSGLSTRQMILLALELRKVEHIHCELLPTEKNGDKIIPVYADTENLLKKLYQ